MSRHFVSIAIAVAVAVSFLFVGAGAVAAHDNGYNVGASGHCSEADSNGGGGAIGVTPNPNPTESSVNLLEDGEAERTVSGVVLYLQSQQDDGQCGSDDESDDSYDYVEAHAGNGHGNSVQVCFSQDTDGDTPPINAAVGGDACHDKSG